VAQPVGGAGAVTLSVSFRLQSPLWKS
jgi:hypothetical protein